MSEPVNQPTPQADDPLAHIALFSRLEPAQRRDLFAAMRRKHVPAHETIFWLGDRGESFFLIEGGSVDVSVPNETGQHVSINTLEAGGFFGEISLLDAGPRTATVRALEPCTLLVLDRETLHRFLRQHPEVGIGILTVMGQRLRANTEQLRHLKNPNEVFAGRRASLWQRASDVIASVAASQWTTVFHICWFGGWIMLNAIGGTMTDPPKVFAFDPFPFGLLTMVVSLEAIFLSIFVMVSQNRQSEKDRLRTDLDYQVNVKAQTEIMAIARKLEQIEEKIEAASPKG
ncbi:MAG: DUF1003 domain-containing protein [Phycisphaerales bacterium]